MDCAPCSDAPACGEVNCTEGVPPAFSAASCVPLYNRTICAAPVGSGRALEKVTTFSGWSLTSWKTRSKQFCESIIPLLSTNWMQYAPEGLLVAGQRLVVG